MLSGDSICTREARPSIANWFIASGSSARIATNAPNVGEPEAAARRQEAPEDRTPRLVGERRRGSAASASGETIVARPRGVRSASRSCVKRDRGGCRRQARDDAIPQPAERRRRGACRATPGMSSTRGEHRERRRLTNAASGSELSEREHGVRRRRRPVADAAAVSLRRHVGRQPQRGHAPRRRGPRLRVPRASTAGRRDAGFMEELRQHADHRQHQDDDQHHEIAAPAVAQQQVQ